MHWNTEKSLGSTIWAMLSKHAVWDKRLVHVYPHHLLLLKCSVCCDIPCHNCCVLNTCSYIYFWSTELLGLLGLFEAYSSSFYSEHAKSWILASRPVTLLIVWRIYNSVLYLALVKSIRVLIVLPSTKASHRIQKQVAPTWMPTYNF